MLSMGIMMVREIKLRGIDLRMIILLIEVLLIMLYAIKTTSTMKIK